jgi:hypothetical protein
LSAVEAFFFAARQNLPAVVEKSFTDEENLFAARQILSVDGGQRFGVEEKRLAVELIFFGDEENLSGVEQILSRFPAQRPDSASEQEKPACSRFPGLFSYLFRALTTKTAPETIPVRST